MNWSTLWLKCAWLAPVLLVATFSAGVFSTIAILARRRGASFSVPRPASRPLVRWGETLLWLLASGLLLTMVAWQFDDWLGNPNSVPEVFTGVLRFMLYSAVGLAAVVVAAATRRPELTGLGFVSTSMVILLSLDTIYEWPEVAAAVRNSPLPFMIATPPDLPPVAVSINDVAFGNTPVDTTWETVTTRTPEWEVQGEFHNQTNRGTLLRGYFRVHAMGLPGKTAERDDKQLFFRYRLEGQPLYVYGPETLRWTGFVRTNFTGMGWSNQGMRVTAQIFPFRVESSLTLPHWGDEVVFLLHRARLLDYAVDDRWCAAFESYGQLGETALISLKPGDPALQSIIDTLARRRYPWLAAGMSNEDAWKRLLELIDAAGERGEIRLAGIDGAAARQIARQLTDESLAQRTAEVLAAPIRLPGSSIETHRHAGEVARICISLRGDRLNERWLRAPVLQQLAIERDAALDTVAPEPDNPIETYVTPTLMRQNRLGDGAERRIGGHAYEQALSRHNWRVLSPDPSHWDDADQIHGTTVNRWLVRLAELDSAFGREFRTRQQDELRTLAKEIWSHEPFVRDIPESLDFLFLDHRADLTATGDKRQTLAEAFQREFFGQIADDRRTDLKIRWTYLARMAPDSQPAQFVKALNDTNPEWLDSGVAASFKQMPPAFAVATLRAVLDDLERLSATGKYSPQPRNFAKDRSILIGEALGIDHPDVAGVILRELDRKDSTLGSNRLDAELREGRVPLAVMQALAASDRPAIRRMIAETGLHRTCPAARRLIELLSADADESVRTAALALLRQWDEWQTRPLPTRILPKANVRAE